MDSIHNHDAEQSIDHRVHLKPLWPHRQEIQSATLALTLSDVHGILVKYRKCFFKSEHVRSISFC
jgi:hypothetical protein